GFEGMAFGRTNVKLWNMAVAAEFGDYDRVIQLSTQTSLGPLRGIDRHQSYWLDLGRAYAHSGKSDSQALVAFMRAERIAPVSFAVNPLAHDALVAMVYRARRRAIPDDLRTLARRVGVDVPV